jgi:hypothetical protein
MKRLFTALLCTISLYTFAQTDSVSLGAGATNMVFYNLANGSQTSATNNDWHIAFAARYIAGFTYASTSQAAAILINEAYGLKLFRCPNQNLAQYASFDTTGWESWQQMHNPDTTWTIGAFNINRNVNDQFNYGWGEYNQGDHNVYGDSSIYLIQLPDGSFKKFVILSLVYDTAFNVQYANLDGSNASTTQIVKNNSKNFLYLNLNTNTVMDKEPALADWDFVALRYNNTVYDSTNLTQDVGILTKDANSVYAASGSDAQQSCYGGSNYANEINLIGKSWMGTPGDTVIPGLAYFLSGPDGSYKITITGFDGATTGVIDFTVGICAQSGISQINASNMDISIYPVPASDQINVRVNSSEESNTVIQLLDMSGRVLISQNTNTSTGENNFPMNIASVQSGNYIVSVSSAIGKINTLISVVK